jgi:iron complex outermembrane receptor protein
LYKFDLFTTGHWYCIRFEPSPGASVLVKGTTNGAQTDPDGKFTIKTTASNAVLIFTYIGLQTQEVNTAGKVSM